MSSFQPINPKPFLKTLVNKQVVVRLKWNKTEYRGTLLSIDDYMNLHLDEAYEKDGSQEELIGEIFIRCNNVLFIREAIVGAGAEPDVKMEVSEVKTEEKPE